MVGPLFYYDLVRLARRGRTLLLRCTYALVIFGAVFFAYYLRFSHHNLLADPFVSPRSLPPREMSEMTAEFARAFLSIQTAAIFILTPAYLAGAIAEEKERRTLELLFTTHVSDREIVVGKMLARVTHLAGILLSGLPVLALMQLWGGVDFTTIVAAFVASGLCLLGVAAVCILCSVGARNVTGAMFASYGLTAAIAALFVTQQIMPLDLFDAAYGDPQVFVYTLPTALTGSAGPGAPAVVPTPAPLAIEKMYLPMVKCMALNGFLVAIGVGISVVVLREMSGVGISWPVAVPHPVGKPADDTINNSVPFDEVPRARARSHSLPAVGDWPLIWKETYSTAPGALTPAFEAFVRKGWPILLVMLAVAPPLAYYVDGCRFFIDPRAADSFSSLLRLAVVGPACAWCIVVGFRAAGGISRERDGQTLESLLTLPVTRFELLGAKWLGPILYGRGFGYLILAAILVGLWTGLLHPLGAILLGAALTVHITFLASMGVWLSLASRTAVWARVTMAMVLLLFLGAALRAAGLNKHSDVIGGISTGVGGLTFDNWFLLSYRTGLNAPGSWWTLTFPWTEYVQNMKKFNLTFFAELEVISCGILVFALAAGIFWGAAWRLFRGELKH